MDRKLTGGVWTANSAAVSALTRGSLEKQTHGSVNKTISHVHKPIDSYIDLTGVV